MLDFECGEYLALAIIAEQNMKKSFSSTRKPSEEYTVVSQTDNIEKVNNSKTDDNSAETTNACSLFDLVASCVPAQLKLAKPRLKQQ
jgi:hypothetical protein